MGACPVLLPPADAPRAFAPGEPEGAASRYSAASSMAAQLPQDRARPPGQLSHEAVTLTWKGHAE
jgi:hypothetical protein